MPTLDHEGVPLAYQIHGNGDPVLLILQRSGSRPALLLVNRNGRSLFFGRSASVRPSVVTFKAVRGPLPGAGFTRRTSASAESTWSRARSR